MTSNRWGFDDWAETYDEDVYDTSRPDQFTFQDYDRVLETIVEYCDFPYKTYTHILDIGIGTGNLARLFLPTGVYITGIDPSEGMLEICHRKFPEIPLIQGHFLDIPLPPESVDLIVSSYALHHLTAEEKEWAVLGMKRTIKPGGRIVLADLMFRNAEERKRIEDEFRKAGKPEIPEEYAPEFPGYFDDLVPAFNAAGFSVDGKQLTQAIWIIRGRL